MSANSALTSMSASNLPLDQPLNHNDYPKVRFWFRKDWINRKKETSGITRVNQSNAFTTQQNRGRAPSGLNVSLRYVEDAHGVVVDGFRASEMRKFARSIWNQLLGAAKAPRSWGKADLDVAAHYRREMCRRFPELGLCEFDWKAEQLATDNYPNWASNNLQGVKLEPSDSSLTQMKRRRDSVGQISKKAKTESISSTPIDIDSVPSSNVVSNATNFPPIDSGSTVTPANTCPSSVTQRTQPATLPTIVTVHTAAPPNMEEFIYPNLPANIASDHPNDLPANPVPTDEMLASVDQDEVLTGPTTALAVSDSVPAVAVMTQEFPTPVVAATPPSFDAVVKDGAAKTANSSQAASPPDGASFPSKSMPRVRMSLLKYLIICSGVVTQLVNPLSLKPLSATVQTDHECRQQSVDAATFQFDPALNTDGAVVRAGDSQGMYRSLHKSKALMRKLQI